MAEADGEDAPGAPGVNREVEEARRGSGDAEEGLWHFWSPAVSSEMGVRARGSVGASREASRAPNSGDEHRRSQRRKPQNLLGFLRNREKG